MVTLLPWLERRWTFSADIRTFPAVIERLAGTPPRAAALVSGVPEISLASRPSGGWSIKEHLGHLADLHSLDMRRVNEFLAGAKVLSAADMTNRRTAEAHHEATPLADLLHMLHDQRQELTGRLMDVTEAEIGASALHPRLNVHVRLIDWAQFVADHDDHHLASARVILRARGELGS